ncbi:MAG TPA: hypothetical protein P5230_01315 [Candidatus Magasanikbacteria bacterium]|nr:hypothetical protein [Candidatus Magasanikbacteria bacterium]
MSIFNLLRIDYWFSQPYILYGGAKWFWLFFILVVIIGAFVFKYLQKHTLDKVKAEIYRRFGGVLIGMSFFLVFWFFFRQQHIPFLAWRFWWMIALFFAVSSALKTMKYMLKRIPEIRKFEEEKQMREKYLPKK